MSDRLIREAEEAHKLAERDLQSPDADVRSAAKVFRHRIATKLADMMAARATVAYLLSMRKIKQSGEMS